ncbi:exosome non-catalytic core subunit RRP43 Ecym_8138 [Eremothecium cymbalariae DBVPG|uniref:Ribosomal RNA-processing protein 43 n=1 Tax=Eremothecium cymbalariae (strain CBS 270.75 / DBVPG 7215 / KCTC 17166 / NRRL Y-17582) TaxID=931890 RepID=G8JX55_ERECY|nr:Hypothetical protein Ecym_8138 [Eremothecium cymbalariae DBVPG\
MSESVEFTPIVFPPRVLARISPELSLQRHLSLGVRPCLRAFEEFREVETSDGNLSRYSPKCNNTNSNNILGSNVLKSGSTIVITSITGGIVEDTLSSNELQEDDGFEPKESSMGTYDKSDFATVYPVVDIERGRVGLPTDEEMIISQMLHDDIRSSGIIPKKALEVICGIRTTDRDGKPAILYPDSDDMESADLIKILSYKQTRKWNYCLYAKIKVFSRDGPLYELCWNSLMYALQTVQLPRAFVDERATDLKIPVRTRGRTATIRETYDLLCDPDQSVQLSLNKSNIAYASRCGVIDVDPDVQLPEDDDQMELDRQNTILVADLQGEAEETSITSTISVITDADGSFKSVTLIGGTSNVSPEIIKSAFRLAKKRSQDLASKIL